MEEEFLNMQMEQSTMDSGKMIKQARKDSSFMRTKKNMKEIF